jgi:2-hydroxy-6-oxonona-2,4-dienedioate hydrolase
MRSMWTRIDGIRIHAAVGGAGRPVVLVHGYGVSGAYMLPLARLLTQSLSAYVPDLPGQGRSDQPRGRCGIAELAGTLGDWLDAVDLDRPALVANSMGCQIVTELAVRRPKQVGPMVLVGPTVDPSRRGKRHQLFGALRDSAREPLALFALAARDGAGVRIGPLLANARSALLDRIEERLPEIAQPTVVVLGSEDGFVSREWAERATGLLPRGRLVVVPGEPHAVHFTRPALVADIVVDLLSKELEDGRDDLAGRFEHRNVSAGNAYEPRAGKRSMPLLRNADRHEPVALAPNE